MEQHDRSQRRQQARQAYGRQQGEALGSEPGPAGAVGSNDGFRQPSYMQQPPVSASIVGRVDGTPTQVYGFASSPQYGTAGGMQSSPMQYAPGITPAEAARQQGQQYPPYGSNLMYGPGAPQGAQTIPSSYEQVPPYRQRPGSGSETLGAPFGVPQYYLAGQTIPTAGNVSELSAQNMPAQYAQPDTYPVTAPATVHAFPTSAMDTSQPVAYNPYVQQAQYAPHMQVLSDEQRLENYHLQVRNIFTLARDGTLQNVGAHLLEVSQYLLGNVEALGLTRDDEALHDGRIRLWDEFNRAWLVSLQRQLDLSQQAMRNGQPLEGAQSLMDAPTLERLSNELVRLCDNIEKHGLVDYQMGVAEEDIMELLLRCQSIVNPGNARTAESASETSRAGASRRR